MDSTKSFFKKISLTILLLTQTYSVTFGAELPLQVQRLTEKRQAAISKINNTFVDELEKIKTNYTKAGDLENANLVATLIKQTKGTVGEEVFSLDGEWRYRIDGKVVSVVRRFEGNQLVDEGGTKRDWVFEGEGITIRWNSRQFEKITLDPNNPDVIKGANGDGTRFTYTRIK
jgi:hypothetical protein